MTKFERITLVLSVVALVTSVGSIFATLWVYEKSVAAVLEVEAWAAHDQPTVRFDVTREAERPVMLRRNVILSFRNRGNVSMTIESIWFWPILPPPEDRGQHVFDTIKPGGLMANKMGLESAKLLNPDGSAFAFPLIIEPRRSVELNAALSMAVSEEVWQRVKEKIALATELSFDVADKIFSEAGFECWGYLERDEYNNRTSRDYVYYSLVIHTGEGQSVPALVDLCGFITPQRGHLR